MWLKRAVPGLSYTSAMTAFRSQTGCSRLQCKASSGTCHFASLDSIISLARRVVVTSEQRRFEEQLAGAEEMPLKRRETCTSFGLCGFFFVRVFPSIHVRLPNLSGEAR